jgi:hypothetical protein
VSFTSALEFIFVEFDIYYHFSAASSMLKRRAPPATVEEILEYGNKKKRPATVVEVVEEVNQKKRAPPATVEEILEEADKKKCKIDPSRICACGCNSPVDKGIDMRQCVGKISNGPPPKGRSDVANLPTCSEMLNTAHPRLCIGCAVANHAPRPRFSLTPTQYVSSV